MTYLVEMHFHLALSRSISSSNVHTLSIKKVYFAGSSRSI